MKKTCCLLALFALGTFYFAQTLSAESYRTAEYFAGIAEALNYTPLFNASGPLQMANGNEEINQNQPIFASAPQWARDLRRGEIVFFGSLPFTVFFTRTIVDLVRMGSHNWDRRYAPWPFQAAGAIMMDRNEIIMMFSIAASVSLVVSITDHLIVRSRRKNLAAAEY